jgi:predicted RNase H-like nuclease (RuvC/YqgF family)
MSSENEIPRLKLKRFARAILEFVLRTNPFISTPEMLKVLDELTRSRTSLDEKVAKAHESLQETVHLIGDLETTLKESTDKLSALRCEYDRYSKLAQVEEQKARAVIEQVEHTLRRGRGRERVERLLIGILGGLVVFVLGVYLGPIIRTWLKIG